MIYEKDIATFIGNALSPSKVVEVFINHRDKAAMVVVPDYQLSLAIGKEGQNARLAAKLTNWKIDIKSETQFDEYLDEIGQTMKEFRENYENTAVQDEEIDGEESPAEEIKEYDNFASIGGLTGMDLNDLFVDALSLIHI